jgi:hypothetical protein
MLEQAATPNGIWATQTGYGGKLERGAQKALEIFATFNSLKMKDVYS